jgi:hypothetical protein
MAETPRPTDLESPAPPDEVSPELGRARARGRRIAFALYYAVAGTVAVAGTLQVFMQALERRESPQVQVGACPEGLSRLVSAIERARAAASLTQGEDAALADFRKALRTEWDDRDHIEDLCRPSPTSMAALDAIEQLRYAEEHAVRREAADLAPLRRRVQAIAPRELGPPADPATPPSSPTGKNPKNP